MREFIVRGFPSTTEALSSLEACRAAGLESRLIQLPASMAGSAECGTALRTLPEDDERVQAALDAAGITVRSAAAIKDFAKE